MKGHHFEHPQHRLFSELPTVRPPPTKTRYVSRHFRRSYLKANKVSNSEETSTAEYAYNFWKWANAGYQKLSKSIYMLDETTACRSWLVFLRHSVHVELAWYTTWQIFIARQHTDARYWYSKSVRLSVCPSVRNVPVSDENGLTYRHSFFTIR